MRGRGPPFIFELQFKWAHLHFCKQITGPTFLFTKKQVSHPHFQKWISGTTFTVTNKKSPFTFTHRQAHSLTGLVVNGSSSLTSWVLLSVPLVTSSSTFSTTSSLLGPWPYLPWSAPLAAWTLWPSTPCTATLATSPTSLTNAPHQSGSWLLTHSSISSLHWGFTVVTSSFSILASSGCFSPSQVFFASAQCMPSCSCPTLCPTPKKKMERRRLHQPHQLKLKGRQKEWSLWSSCKSWRRPWQRKEVNMDEVS